MKKMNNKKGYTMTELLVVVTVIGILSAIAIPLFSALIEAQNTSMCHVCQQTLYQKYINYYYDDIDFSKYPDENPSNRYPFLEGHNSYDQSTEKLEDVFRQSFIDYMGGTENMPTCVKHDCYYVIKLGSDLIIECHEKDGELTEEHNNSTIF